MEAMSGEGRGWGCDDVGQSGVGLAGAAAQRVVMM